MQLDVGEPFFLEVLAAVVLQNTLKKFSRIVGVVHEDAQQVFYFNFLIFFQLELLVLLVFKGSMRGMVH